MIFDLLGIGLGPFNLGLAALAADIPNLTTCFVDQRDNFNWHPGLLLPGARLQVPFYADLVTLVQPTSRYSWFSFLQAKQRLFRFGVQDNPFPLRREYNEYGQWVAAQLRHLHWGKRCESLTYNDYLQVYGIHVLDVKTGMRETFHAKHLVIGIGSVPFWPTCVKELIAASNKENQVAPIVFHAADYLFNKPTLTTARHITIIGSGQSAAEVFQDSLTFAICTLSWFTRSPRFFPMEVTPPAFEMSSPDYREHFYNLPPAMKEFILAGQDTLYKGINANLLTSIYQQLYERSLAFPSDDVTLMPNCELTAVEPNRTAQNELICTFRHRETNQTFEHRTDALILATGYKEQPPVFLGQIKGRINYLPSGRLDIARNYAITSDQTIFIQNAECHSHGFASSDLSFGPYRNAVILNQVLGYEHFTLEKNIAFQSFDGTSNT